MGSGDQAVTEVSALRPGQDVDGVFACTRKDRLVTRSGSPYLALELRDRSGAVSARAFQNADALAGRFERGEHGAGPRPGAALPGRARGGGHSDRPRASRAPTRSAFLPTAYRDLDELDGFLEHLAGEVYDRGYKALLERLLGDAALRAAWRLAPCAAPAITPISAVCWSTPSRWPRSPHEVCQLHPQLNSDLLLTAALTHDLGRTREFTYGAEIGLTEEGRLLGHIVIGERLLAQYGAGVLDDGAQPRARPLSAVPSRARVGPGRPLRVARGARAVPPQRLDAAIKGARGAWPRAANDPG